MTVFEFEWSSTEKPELYGKIAVKGAAEIPALIYARRRVRETRLAGSLLETIVIKPIGRKNEQSAHT